MDAIRRGVLGILAGTVVLAGLMLPATAAAAPVPLSSFGSTGTGAGQLNDPRGIVVDGNGRVYVAEHTNNRISVFEANGTFVHAFGLGVDTGMLVYEVCTAATTCQAGLGLPLNGAMQQPRGIALDGAGNLYVADRGNHRISVFNTAGPSFVRAFGWDVAEPNDAGPGAFENCPSQGACRSGENGGNGGQLNNPFDVAVDGGGKIFVADQNNHRISVFNGGGTAFVHAFGWDVLEPDGTMGLETCTTGLCRAGDPVGLGGGLSFPYGVAIDAGGDLYISDAGNNRVSQFNSETQTFTRAFGWDVAEPDDVMPPEFESCTTQATCRPADAGGGAGQVSDPKGAAVDAAGNLYISDDDNHRLSVFNPLVPSFTHAFGWDVIPGGASGLFELCTSTCGPGTSGSGVGQFNDPEALETDCRGNVWVTDLNNGRVQRLGEPGTALPPCTTPPTGGGGGSTTTPPPAKKKCKKGRKLKKGKCVKKKRKKK